MKYSSGNYQAFARAQKPKGIDEEEAFIIGSGLAALSTACFLIRDGHMDGSQIHILERDKEPGGACGGFEKRGVGYVLEGGRDVDAHFEVLWDLLRSIPSLDTPGASVLDEVYWLNEEDPSYSIVRGTRNRGDYLHTDLKFNLSDQGVAEIVKLFLTPDEELYDQRIDQVLTENVLSTDFWLFWSTTFGFERWHSILNLKNYLQRFIYDFDGIADQSTVKCFKYNPYQSMILPILKYLENHGVDFRYGVKVTNVDFEITDDSKVAKSITVIKDGEEDVIPLTEKQKVFITIGGSVENLSVGSQKQKPVFDTEIKEGGGWDLWRKISVQDNDFGNPDKFCENTEHSKWVTATITTLDDKIPPYIKAISRRDPFAGKVITGGYITIEDSAWLLSWSFGHQPQFKDQPKEQLVGWMYGLRTDNPGDYVKKPMYECTGKEICMEWLYHMGVPEKEIEKMASKSANTVPTIIPYIAAFFTPRAVGDRPEVVPEDAKNFAFIGQYARTERDTVFTTEYSVRTAMEGAYTLFNIDRAVPEVWASMYDIRDLLAAVMELRDGKNILDANIGFKAKRALKEVIKATEGTEIYTLLEKYDMV